MISIDDIRERLREVRPPGLNRDIVTGGLVREVGLKDGVVEVRDRASGDRSDVPVGEAVSRIAEVVRA